MKLSQVDRWQPDPSTQRSVIRVWHWPPCFDLCLSLAGCLRWARGVEIFLEWVLAKLFATGVTDVVRRD